MRSSDTHDDTYSAYELGPFRSHDWPVCHSLDDPGLGLAYEQLTDTWAPLGLPVDWDAELAAQYAMATWLTLSRTIGSMSGLRLRWPEIHRWLLATVVASVPPHPVAFEAFAEHYYERLEAAGRLGVGLGSPETIWKRLVAQFAELGPVRDVHAGLGSRPWKIANRRDSVVLDGAWDRAQEAADGDELLAVLPVRVLCGFAPPRRQLIVDEGHGRSDDMTVLKMPSAWELVATAVFLGPQEWRRRGHAAILHAAGREGGQASSTMKGARGLINSMAMNIAEASKHLPCGEPWRSHDFRVQVPRSAAKMATKTTPRVAPPLAVYRHADATWQLRLDRARRECSTGSVPSPSYLFTLRRLLYQHLGLTLRINEICGANLDDVSGGHAFPNGYVGPAVYCRPSKDGDNVTAHWKPLHPRTWALLDEWIDRWQLYSDPRNVAEIPLFPESWENRQTAQTPERARAFFTGWGRNRPVVPHPVRHHYAIHEATRHLAAQLAVGLASDWLFADVSIVEKVTPGVIVSAQLHHTFKTESYDYLDLEANRELLALRAGLGDPDKHVPGVLNLALGPEGARRRWDERALRSALSQLKAAEIRLTDGRRHERDALAAVARLERRLSRPAGVDRRALDAVATAAQRGVETQDNDRLHDVLLQIRGDLAEVRKLVSFEQERHAIRDELEAAKHRLHVVEREIDQVNHVATRARLDLDVIEARGRTVLMPDTDPLPHERPKGSMPPESESFADALTRISSAIGDVDVGVPMDEAETMLRIRPAWNGHEFAAIFAATDRAFRRWVDGSRTGPLPHHQLVAAVVEMGPRQRVVVADMLPGDFWANLSPAQSEMAEQFLRVPMGATQHGGISITDEAVEAAIAARRSAA